MRSVDRKQVGLASALAAALAALGCGAKGDIRPLDDGGPPPPVDAGLADVAPPPPDGPPPRLDMAPVGNPNEAVVVTSWRLAFVEGSPGLGCDEAGTPNITIRAVNTATKAATTDKLPCMAGGGASRVLMPGAYDVTVQLEDAQGRAVSAVTSSLSLVAGANDTGALVFSVQSFRLTWGVERNQATVSCQAAGAATVELTATLGMDVSTYKFPCASGEGQTTAVRVGTYTVAVKLKDMAGETLSEVPATTFMAAPDKRATFPRITFAVR